MNNGHYQTADPPMPRDMVFAVRYAAKPQVERVARILKRCIRLRHDGLADNEIDAEIKKHVAKVRSINTSPKSEEVAAASSMATTGLGMSLVSDAARRCFSVPGWPLTRQEPPPPL
eukprot:scaffold2771_cov252-Pinguiococcus_pyrenoidosus.AAC.20